MILFSLFSIPLTYLIVNSFFNNYNIRKRTVFLPFVYGMTLSIPILILYWLFFQSFFNNWSPLSLYFFHFLNRDGAVGIYIVLVLLFILLYLNKGTGESRLREITAYLAGLYFTMAIYDFLVAENWYGGLELLLIPIVRISSILLISVLISKVISFPDWRRYLWGGLSLLVPVITTFISVTYVINLVFFSVVISLLLLICSIIMYSLEYKGKFFFS